MLDIIFIILMLFNIILMIYAIEERRIPFCFLSSILWLILALFLIQGIEIPYEMYNASSTKIITGVHLIQTNLSPLSYLFSGLAVVMFILTITFILEAFGDYKKIK